jgi:hypothetical protein
MKRKRKRYAALAALVLAGLGAGPAAADPAGTPSPVWVPDGEVNAVAVSGSTAYIGGQFSKLAPLTGGSAALDPTTGRPRGAWPDVAGMVLAAIPDGSGGWYLGGAFTAVGGVQRQNLAHVRADGTLDPAWAPSVRGHVRALARHGTTVFAGGRFDLANGVARGNLAGFHAVTGALSSFSGAVAGSAPEVNALAVAGAGENTTLYAGGAFSTAGGYPRANLAAFGVATSVVRPFDPRPNNEVLSLAATATTVYAGGAFTTVNGFVSRRHLAAFEWTQGYATSWDPDVDGPVRAIQLAGSTLYAGGKFSRVNDRAPVAPSKPRASLAAFDTGTGVATSWAPQLGGPFSEGALTLGVGGSTVYVGGMFTQVNGTTPRVNAAAFDATSGAVTPFDPSPDVNGLVNVIARQGNRVVAGGTFRSLGGVTRHNLAAIDLATGRPTAFDPRPNLTVNAVAVAGSKVWAGGWFNRVGAQSVVRERLAAFDAGTGAATPFSQHIDQPVDALAVSGSTVYAGGRFTVINGVSPRRHLAAFRDVAGTTGALTTFDPDVDGPVGALALAGDRLYVGGEFATVGGAARRNLAAVSTATGAPQAFRADLDARVRALAVGAGTVYAGGDFRTVGGATPRDRLVALDAQSAAPRPWKADADAPVRALALAGGQLIAGGDFSTIGGAARSYVAALSPSSGAVAPWAPKLTTSWLYPVRSLAATAQGGLVAGGRFSLPLGAVRAENVAVFGPAAAAAPAPAAPASEPIVHADRTAPVLTALRALKRRRVAIAVTEPAIVRFTARRGRRTVRFTRTVPAGRSRLAIRRRELRRGRYRLSAVPADLAGNVGPARTVRLRVR